MALFPIKKLIFSIFMNIISISFVKAALGTCDASLNDTSTNKFTNGTLRVGILHSLTGTMSISENTVVDSVLLAIEEVNNSGGVLGAEVVPVLYDGASDWPTFAERAQNLIDLQKVEVVFGCWTSASRKAVLPVFEQKNHILFYPVQYEGEECSKNIFYTGAAPNQQITPAVDWLAEKYPGKDFFLMGSDYVFPRIANEIITNQVKDKIKRKSMEMYIPLGGTEVDAAFDAILKFMPNGGIIFNTLNGDTNISFFKKYKQLGLKPDKYPTLSVSISEVEIEDIGKDLLLDHFACWNYFMTIDSPENKDFIAAFHKKYGNNRLINDPMECAYNSVHLWAKSVKSAGTTDLAKVRLAAMGQEFVAPQGKISLDTNHHLTKWIRIGKVNSKGLFDIVYSSPTGVRAEPFSPFYPALANEKCDWSGTG